MCDSRRILGCIFNNPQEKEVESMENTKILYAHEANRIAKEKNKDIQENLKEIEEKIRCAADNGYFSVMLNGSLRKIVNDELVKLGYDVQTYLNHNENVYVISWDK
jgi:hypothetical protein